MILRPVHIEDMDQCRYFFDLRNEREATLMSRRKEIPWEVHTKWWWETGDRRWVAVDEVTGGMVGTIRIAPDGVLSIVVDPAFRGMGLGTAMLQEARVAARTAGFKHLYAEVAAENTRSQRAFAKAGWCPVLWEVGV